MGETIRPGAGSRRGTITLWICAALVWSGAATVPAFADDMMMGAGSAVFALVAIIFAIPIVLACVGGTVLIEAYVLARFFQLTFRRGLGYAFLMNLASFLVGSVLYATLPGRGWKTALITHQYAWLGLALVRSFGITMAVEAAVLFLLLRGQQSGGMVLKATAWANLLSYVLTAVLLMGLLQAFH